MIKELIQLTRGILLINSDSYSTLNIRKKLIQCDWILPEEEIEFLNLLFTKHPKSVESWSHR